MSANELLARNGPDGRELHRPSWQSDNAEMRLKDGSTQNRIFSTLQKFAQIRQQRPEFQGDVPVKLIDTTQASVLGLARHDSIRGYFNFSKQAVSVEATQGAHIALKPYGFAWVHHTSGETPLTLID